MKINLTEISKLIDEQLSIYEPQVDEEEIGKVLDVRDGIVQISGLSSAMMNELLQFENGIMGIALNLSEDSIGAIILGEYIEIHEGSTVRRTNQLLSIPVGENFLGRVINPLGEPLDGLDAIESTIRRPIEITAPGVVKRQPVHVPLQTGIKSIDAMIPIGRGQRELIIGDRQTGKTAICVDTIINQKNTGVICIYIAIGQKASTVASVVEKLKQHDAMKHTIVVTTTANDEAPLLYIAPYAGCAMAEYFMYEKHRDTLCVYDDLTKQANAYRQISLLLQRPPGREAFPGDVFYLHSRLLERAAKLSEAEGGGSLTALPIIETQEGEVAAYIPTNVISITDGQIYLRPDLFASGIRPAVDVGISVSRVGGNAQISAMKKVAGSLRLDMAQFKNLEAFAQLATDMDETTRNQLNRGYRLTEILKQAQYKPMPVEEQVLIIFAGINGALDALPVSKMAEFEEFLIEQVRQTHPEFLDSLVKTKQIQNKEALLVVIKDMAKQFKRNLD